MLDMTYFGGRRLLFAAMLLALPLPAMGCGRTACFQWTAEEGACPSQAEAFKFFTGPGCPGKVNSVDGKGSFDGLTCCYPVSQDELSPAFGSFGCNGFGGAPSTGAVGQTAVSTGFVDVGGAGGIGGTGGVGGAGGGGGCIGCSEALQMPSSSAQVCDGSVQLFNELFTCACDPAGPCQPSCMDDLCKADAPLVECTQCMQMPGPSGCGEQFAACANDI